MRRKVTIFGGTVAVRMSWVVGSACACACGLVWSATYSRLHKSNLEKDGLDGGILAVSGLGLLVGTCKAS